MNAAISHRALAMLLTVPLVAELSCDGALDEAGGELALASGDGAEDFTDSEDSPLLALVPASDQDQRARCRCAPQGCFDSLMIQCGEWLDLRGSCGHKPCPESSKRRLTNEDVIDCTLGVLATGSPGEFRRVISGAPGEGESVRFFVLPGDGTLLDWSRADVAGTVSLSPVELRAAPSAQSVAACAEQADPEERWACLEAALSRTAPIATCGEPTSWVDEL